MTTDFTPFLPASSQKGVPRRLFVAGGSSEGGREEREIPMKVNRAAATSAAKRGMAERGDASDAAPPSPPLASRTRLLRRTLKMPHTTRNASRPSTAGTPTRFRFPSRKLFFPSSSIANSGRYVFGSRLRQSKIH